MGEMQTLIFGAGGMLGTDLAATAPVGVTVVALDKREADVTDRAQIIRVLDEHKPGWVINASAYSRVDDAEANLASARAVNADAPGLIGAECARRGLPIVHFSTDYVFRGDASQPYDETAAADPINAYGRTKLSGEQALLASGAEALIIRTQWLFGRAGPSFPRTMLDRAKSGLKTRVVNDQVGRPTYTIDLARATWQLVELDARDVCHVVNGGAPATWYDVASVVFNSLGRPELLSPCTTDDYPTPARRPKYSVLDTRRADALLNSPLPDWQDALMRFLAGF